MVNYTAKSYLEARRAYDAASLISEPAVAETRKAREAYVKASEAFRGSLDQNCLHALAIQAMQDAVSQPFKEVPA